MDKIKICQNCKKDNPFSNNYCRFCGDKLTPKVSSKKMTKISKLIPRSQNKMTFIPIVGGLGIIIVGLSLFQILGSPQFQIDPFLVSIIGFIVFAILLLGSIILKIKTKVDQLTPLFLMFLSEILLLISQFFLDLVDRTNLSRNLLLWSSILISSIGAFSALIFQDSQLQQIHRIGSAYIGWIIIYYISGSTYVSEISLTLAVIIQILLMHFIGLIYPRIIVVSAYVSLEFLVLIQSQVINSTSILFVALVVIISIPIILYFKKFPKLMRSGFIISNNSLILLYSIPLLSIVISISNGAIIAPYTHILFAIFCISWSIYIYIFRNEENYRETLQSLSKSMILLFLIGISIYSYNSTGLDLISLHLGLTIAILLLRNLLDNKNQTYVKILNLAVTLLVSTQLYVASYYNFIISLSTFAGSIILIFGKEFYKLKIDEIDTIAIFMGTSSFSSLIYFQRQFSIVLLVGNLFLLLPIYILKYRLKYQSRYWSVILGQVLVLLSFLKYAEPRNDEIIIIIFSIFFLFSISLLDRSLPADNMTTGWLLLSLALIMSMNNLVNHYLINAISFFLLGFAFFSLFLNTKGYMQQYIPLIFALTGVYSRIIIQGESSELFNITVWSLSTIFIYMLLWILVFIVTNTISDGNNLYQFIIYNTSSVLTGFFIISKSKEYDEIRIRSIITLLILVFFLIQLIFLNINWKLYKSYKISQKIVAISFLGILNYILLVTYPQQQGFQIIWLPIIGLLILSGFIGKDDQLTQLHKLIWFISIIMNLLLLIYENEFSMGISIIIILFIYLYSSNFRELFKNLTEETTKLNYLFDISGYFILSSLTAILVKNDKLDNLFGIGIWIILLLLLFGKNIKSKIKIDGLHIIQAVVISYTSLIWLNTKEFEYVIYVIGLIISLVFINLDNNKIFERSDFEIIPKFTEATIGVSSFIFAQIIGISWIILRNKVVSLNQIFRFLAIIMFVILLFSMIIERIYRKNTLSDSLIITSFLLAITSSLIGYFETSLSNLILAILAISISVISLIIRESKLFYIGLGISIISLIKGIVDLIVLDPLDRSISLLVVGIQAIWYAIVYNSLQSRIKNE